MRLVTIVDDHGRKQVGIRTPEGIIATEYSDMLEVIAGGPEVLEGLREIAENQAPMTQVGCVIAPLRPGKMLFCGVNFPSHLKENPGATLPREPFFFSKLPSAIIGQGEPIEMPNVKTELDYEVELAVVIGRTARRVESAAALDYVFGYTLVNDVSARDVQFTDQQITLGKNADTFCPLGPEIVTSDEFGDPSAVTISCTVNGESRQSASTSELLFAIQDLISRLSATITLSPGDIVTSGTPAGVGCFRNPPQYLEPGDEVTISCDRIGSLTNPVVAGW